MCGKWGADSYSEYRDKSYYLEGIEDVEIIEWGLLLGTVLYLLVAPVKVACISSMEGATRIAIPVIAIISISFLVRNCTTTRKGPIKLRTKRLEEIHRARNDLSMRVKS